MKPTLDEQARRERLYGDDVCAMVAALLVRIRAHTHGESPIGDHR